MIAPLIVFLLLQRSFVKRDPGRLRQVMTAERLMAAFAGTVLPGEMRSRDQEFARTPE